MTRKNVRLTAGLACLAGLAAAAGAADIRMEKPLLPGASVAFRIPDRSTNVEPAAIGLLVVGSDAGRAQAAAGVAVQGLKLAGSQGGDLPFSTRVVPGPKDLSGDVPLRIDVVRQAWEPGWYELRLTLSDPDVLFAQEAPSRPDGTHVLRFRVGSEPLLRAAHVCVKADRRRMVVLDLSEPLAASPAALVLDDGTPCPDPAAGALAGREPVPRRRLYRLCPEQGSGAALKLSPPLTGKGELRWSLPTSPGPGEDGEPCRTLAVE
jgi:hypothetical protein